MRNIEINLGVNITSELKCFYYKLGFHMPATSTADEVESGSTSVECRGNIRNLLENKIFVILWPRHLYKNGIRGRYMRTKNIWPS